MERIRAKQEKHRQGRVDLDRPEDPLDPGQEPGERGWSLRGPRALAHLCHWSLPCYVPRDVTQGFQPICPVPCGHALSPQATRPASDCPSALVSCPPTPQHHEGVLVTVGALHLLCQGAPPRSPVFLPAGSCLPPPPLHRARQSRGLLPATETVVAALAGPRHRYHPNPAAVATWSSRCVLGSLPLSVAVRVWGGQSSPGLTPSLCAGSRASLQAM